MPSSQCKVKSWLPASSPLTPTEPFPLSSPVYEVSKSNFYSIPLALDPDLSNPWPLAADRSGVGGLTHLVSIAPAESSDLTSSMSMSSRGGRNRAGTWRPHLELRLLLIFFIGLAPAGINISGGDFINAGVRRALRATPPASPCARLPSANITISGGEASRSEPAIFNTSGFGVFYLGLIPGQAVPCCR